MFDNNGDHSSAAYCFPSEDQITKTFQEEKTQTDGEREEEGDPGNVLDCLTPEAQYRTTGSGGGGGSRERLKEEGISQMGREILASGS